VAWWGSKASINSTSGMANSALASSSPSGLVAAL
jgi:hypothetical protein